jgi:hypothetical protein
VAITKTLAVVRNRAIKEAGITLGAGTDPTKRHDTTDANTFLNDSHRALMSLLTTRGFDFYITETALAALPTSRADTNEQYSLIPWPDGSVLVKRIDVYVAGEWHELERRDWTQLRSESRSSAGSAARPLVYAPKTQGAVSGSTFTSGKIAIAPFASTGTYKVSYLPEWADITNDAHLFLYPDEWCAQWVLWDYVIKVAARDNDAQRRFAIAQERQAKAEAFIGHFVPQIVSTGPLTVTRSPDYNR